MLSLITLIVIVAIISLITFFIYISYDVITNLKRIMECINNRTVTLSMNLSNNLTNSITIGTSIGDFVANVYNAVGTYDVTGVEFEIEFEKLYEMFNCWTANNSYNNVLFRSNNYNRSKLYTLPCYLADVYIESNKYYNNYEIFGEAAAYGYSLNIKGTVDNKIGYLTNTEDTLFSKTAEKSMFEKRFRFTITKLNNTYCRLELDQTDFNKYIDKFFQYVYDTELTPRFNNNQQNTAIAANSNDLAIETLLGNNAKDTNVMKHNGAGTNQFFLCFDSNETLYTYYQYFIIIYKLKKQFTNATTITSTQNNAFKSSIYNGIIGKSYKITYTNSYMLTQTATFTIDSLKADEKRLMITRKSIE